MIKLTKKMNEILKNADLATGEINDVPMSTMYGLEERKLVTADWRKAMSHSFQTTAGGTFPSYSRVKLTAEGLRAARTIQGLRADL
jgi:hypothetical protein